MKAALIKALEIYEAYDHEETMMVNKTLDYLKGTDDYLGKINKEGHITGSAWIVNSDRDKALLTHHYKLDMWIQLGGHTELNETVCESAFREGLEESGLKQLILINEHIFDVDVHLIPARKNEKAHYHYDIRYIFEADDSIKLAVSDESHDLAWIPLNDMKNYTTKRSVLRMVEKMEGQWIKSIMTKS